MDEGLGAFHRALGAGKRCNQKRRDSTRRDILAHRPMLDPIFEGRCDALAPVTVNPRDAFLEALNTNWSVCQVRKTL